MDCDFCDTFKNSGVTLRTIKEAMTKDVIIGICYIHYV